MLGMTPEWYAPKGTAAYGRAHEAREIGAVAQAQKEAVRVGDARMAMKGMRNAAGPKQDGISGVSKAARSSDAADMPPDTFRPGMAKNNYAEGGEVHYCSMTRGHDRSCAYYAEGGSVEPAADDPLDTVAHAAIHHGLRGLLENVGKSSIQDPEKHAHILEDAKNQHGERSSQAGEEFKRTLGNRIGDHVADQDHEKMADSLQGHPLVGSVGKTNLSAILQRLGQPMVERPTHPAAFRGAVDYIHSAIKGGERLDGMVNSLIGSGGEKSPVEKKERESLKEKMAELRDNPEELFEVGGSLGHYLPEHHAALSATAATATDYLNGLEPVQKQAGPLDEPSPPDPLAQAKHDRALDIAHQPLVTLQRVKEGTLLPQDVQTIKTIYPKLYQAMSQKMMARIIDAKSKKEFIPYAQRLSMSLFLGEPLDFTMTPAAAQAIMSSAAVQQAQKQAQPGKGKPSAQAMNQINKTDELYALPTERRELDKRD